LDGPTFLCSIGWDWIPAIRDRNTGIWQKVFLSATGNVLIQNPLVTTDLPLPETDSADVSIQATLKNLTDQPQKGVLKGTFGGISFQKNIELQAHAAQTVKMDSKEFPQFHLTDPTLWWPNGYGPQNLYALQLSVEVDGVVSDFKNFNFGVREYSYSVPDSENLTLSVNGVKVLCKGGNWGMDEAMKRIPRERLEAQIRMHQIANYNMIRNWVGQSTSEDFYELCDKYGIMLWDEFFQPNPNDGPNPKDLNTYIANVRDKILRFRNHPSIAVWCARNEGHPPKEINDKLRTLMAELEPTRLYQSSSSDGRGVHSSGPYFWRRPAEYYKFSAPFKTEIGSVSIPTLESVQGMMPRKDWESINDDWAEHDLAKGAQQRRTLYSDDINNRYGKAVNLADFVRKAQLANYEAFRAMYEGRNAKLFNPCTGILTWMSNPAQPSFVWQLYHHDLEPNSSLFATRKACEPVHIQLNEKEWQVEVINNLPTALENARAHIDIYNLDSSLAYTHDFDVTARPCTVTNLGKVEWPEKLSSVHFIRLRLYAGIGELISDNFYWREFPVHKDELKDLNKLPVVTLDVKAKRRDADGKCFLDVTVNNPSSQIALMAHLQLHRQRSNDRVLPVYYTDNYISLVPNESKTITIEAALSDLKGEIPLILVDGWNIGVKAASFDQVAVGLNENTQVSHWPITNISIAKTFGLEL
jgi:beta-mannosidase